MTAPLRARRFGARTLGHAVAISCLLAAGLAVRSPSSLHRARVEGPAASAWTELVASSTAIGPARVHTLSVLIDLRAARRPSAILAWAGRHHLTGHWSKGSSWVSLAGTPAVISRAFGVAVLDYRSPSGKVFVATPRPARLPTALAGTASDLGRIASFSLKPPVLKLLPELVPVGGLGPGALAAAYDAGPLHRLGYTGTGQTVVIFDWAPPSPADLTRFDSLERLPPAAITLASETRGTPFAGAPKGADFSAEADLDVEVVHAIAPSARLVVFDADPSANDSPSSIAALFQDVARRYPGAIWSSSIGWLCDRFYSSADLRAINASLAAAEAKGTTAFDAAGDTDGFECKEDYHEAYDTPPGPRDIGVDAIASLPAMTSVGGTTLSVSRGGAWFSEEVWNDSVTANGTGGGLSAAIPRPSWQRGPGVAVAIPAAARRDREVPDVSADADPRTGATVVIGGRRTAGGGTSQAAPIWAGLCALLDQYLEQHGGHALGALNPLLYELAASKQPYPPFHDVTVGGNAVYQAGVGYDPASGLGTPIADDLAVDLLRLERSSR